MKRTVLRNNEIYMRYRLVSITMRMILFSKFMCYTVSKTFPSLYRFVIETLILIDIVSKYYIAITFTTSLWGLNSSYYVGINGFGSLEMKFVWVIF